MFIESGGMGPWQAALCVANNRGLFRLAGCTRLVVSGITWDKKTIIARFTSQRLYLVGI